MLRELESLMPRLEAMLCRVPCKGGSDSRKAGVSPCGERKPMRMSQPRESRRLSGQKKHLLSAERVLFDLDFVCLVGSALARNVGGPKTFPNRARAQLGAKRRIVLSLPFLIPALFTIAQTDLSSQCLANWH